MGRIIPRIMENKNVWNHQAVLMYCIMRPWHVRSFTRKLLGHWDCIVPSTRAEPPADNGHHVGGIHDIMLIFQGIHGNPWPWVSEYMTWSLFSVWHVWLHLDIAFYRNDVWGTLFFQKIHVRDMFDVKFRPNLR
jgi:hypothetical protein